MVHTDAELVLGEDHAVGLLAAQLGRLELRAVGHDRAGTRDADGLAGRDVRRAADDLRLLAAPDVDDADRQPVGVGMWLGAQHPADDEVLQRADAVVLDAVDLRAGHRQARRELTDGQVGRAIFLEPLDGDLHPNCSRKRTSLS